jgi:hypothetical protein
MNNYKNGSAIFWLTFTEIIWTRLFDACEKENNECAQNCYNNTTELVLVEHQTVLVF